jgi:prevent-host-death family protein
MQVRMTRKTRAATLPEQWALRDAKARLSEVIRKAKTEGPQHITVHGREEVVVVSVEEYRRIKGDPTGQILIDLMQNSPLGDIESEHARTPAIARRVKL